MKGKIGNNKKLKPDIDFYSDVCMSDEKSFLFFAVHSNKLFFEYHFQLIPPSEGFNNIDNEK